MIKNILELLTNFEAANVCEEIEIAKGHFAIPTTFKQMMGKIIREYKFKNTNG